MLDEYDTPMQEAYVHGYWDEIVSFTRNLFNNTFKTNPYMKCAIMTGITRVSKESVFSDFNNVRVVTTTSEMYETAFGFTEQEVFAALDEYGMGQMKKDVKEWYDGFRFGSVGDIYNPWSILYFMKSKQLDKFWTNTSSNDLVDILIRQGNRTVKTAMEDLLSGRSFKTVIDEQIVFNRLDRESSAIWSLLVASGYLKVLEKRQDARGRYEYTLCLTNKETELMFEDLVSGWFLEAPENYNGFVKALLAGDLKGMNLYMNNIVPAMVGFYDSGKKPSEMSEPERFYHGFVLGLLVELKDRYQVTSNRESGYGRYDVMLEPLDNGLDGIVMEFKVLDSGEEKSLEDTVDAALKQIEEKKYDEQLLAGGIAPERIRHYGFAFEGKKVMIGTR